MDQQINISIAIPEDAVAILALQKLAYRSEALLYNDFSIPPLVQTLEEIRQEFPRKTFLKATIDRQIVGSVRGYQSRETCWVGRLMVHPDFQGQGLGTALMRQMERSFPEARRAELFTGHKSEKNLRLYERLGYTIFKREPVTENLIFVFMQKDL